MKAPGLPARATRARHGRVPGLGHLHDHHHRDMCDSALHAGYVSRAPAGAQATLHARDIRWWEAAFASRNRRVSRQARRARPRNDDVLRARAGGVPESPGFSGLARTLSRNRRGSPRSSVSRPRIGEVLHGTDGTCREGRRFRDIERRQAEKVGIFGTRTRGRRRNSAILGRPSRAHGEGRRFRDANARQAEKPADSGTPGGTNARRHGRTVLLGRGP